MARLKRVTNKIFGSTASTVGSVETGPEIGQFGSAKIGTYNATSDVEEIQSLSAYNKGWIEAVIPNQQYPTLPEMTGVNKVLSYQTGYLMQEGIAEWDIATEYFKNSIVKSVSINTVQNATASKGDSTGITAVSINEQTFLSQINIDGTYTFTYNGSNWLYNSIETNLTLYGLSVTGTAVQDDEIIVTVATTSTINDLVLYKSLTNNNIGNNPQTDTINWEELNLGGGGSSRNIGEIVQSTIPQTDAGLHLLDGALISGSGSYADFVDYIADLYNSGDYTAIFETEANWQTSVTTYGVCGKFVYDSINNTVRLPKYNSKIYTGGGNASVKGNGMTLGLTNGNNLFGVNAGSTGNRIAIFNNNTYGTPIGTVNSNYSSQTSDSSVGITTDGTKSGIIADLANITTSLDGYYYIVVATTTKTDIQVDIDEIATDLNGKADLDLSNVPTTRGILMETYKNGLSWYRVYSDGWCEQGGFKASVSYNTSTSVSLLKNYADTNYEVLCTGDASSQANDDGSGNVPAKTVSGFTLFNTSTDTIGYYWRACGYIS